MLHMDGYIIGGLASFRSASALDTVGSIYFQVPVRIVFGVIRVLGAASVSIFSILI